MSFEASFCEFVCLTKDHINLIIWLVLFGMLKVSHLDPFVAFEVTVKVKVEDFSEEERILSRMLLKDGERKNSCSLGEYFPF